MTGHPQVVHGDLAGNVLFDEGTPPLVIDLSPYWRPPAYADAIVVIDALLFQGAGPDVVELLHHRDRYQYLLRALVFRLVTDREPTRPDADDVARLVLRLVAG